MENKVVTPQISQEYIFNKDESILKMLGL